MMGVSYACVAMSQSVTGGALNPTIGLCGTLFRVFVRRSTEPLHIKYIVSYMLAPLLSGVLAGVFIRFFAIKVTPPNPHVAGSPFLAPKLRKPQTLNDSRNTMNFSS